MTYPSPPLQFSDEVAQARQNNQPIVALESTVISHGLPYPRNVETALAMQQAIRDEGAVPATIALDQGQIQIGLSDAQIDQLGQASDVVKVSRRDIAAVLATGRMGATTVAGTMVCANWAGIHFFATGGIGGVHRGGETSFDISADLTELARTAVMVVSSGAKSILDIPRTLEFLETQGVPILGYQTDDFPAFHSRQSGLAVDHQMTSAAQAAKTAQMQWQCQLPGLLVVNPVPEAAEIARADVEEWVAQALVSAEKDQITGKAVTPYLLKYLAEISEGRSITANNALLCHNATIAAKIAVAYHRL